MSLTLSDEAERLIREKVLSGQYRSADEVVLAGLGSLEQEEQFGDFTAGEWDAILRAGEQSVVDGRIVDASEAFHELRARFGKTNP